MDAGQMNMMQMMSDATMPAAAATAKPESGQKSGEGFARMLGRMTPQVDVKPVVASAGGMQAPVLEKAEPPVVLQSGISSGLMAALLNGTGTAVTSLAAADGNDVPAQEAAACTGDLVERPQEVAGGQSNLLAQANSGRTPDPNDIAVKSEKMPQEVALNIAELQSALLIQANNGRMPASNVPNPENAKIAPMISTTAEAAVQSVPKTMVPGTEKAQLPIPQAAAVTKTAIQQPALSDTELSELVSAERGANVVKEGTVAALPAAEDIAKKIDHFVPTIPVSSVEVLKQQQDVTLPRSSAVEVALMEAAPGSVDKLEKQSSTPVVQPGRTVVTPESNGSNLEALPVDAHARLIMEPRSVPVNGAPERGRKSSENHMDAVQVNHDRGAAVKSGENLPTDATKNVNTVTAGELGSGDEKESSADQFMGGQFRSSQMHMQGKPENQGAVNSVFTPTVQSETPRTEVSDQIGRQVKDHLVNHELKAGNEQIALKLSPENLGDLKLNLNMDGQRLKVEIVTENRMVRDALLQQADSLKETLARQNITIDSFNVTTNGRGAGNPHQGQGHWNEFARQKHNTWMPADGYRLPNKADTSQLTYLVPQTLGMVDLHF